MTNVEAANLMRCGATLLESMPTGITARTARHSVFVIPSCLGISCFVIALRVRVLPSALCFVWLICAGSAAAQSPSAKDVSCRIGASAGAWRYRPGVWGLVEVSVINQTKEVAEAQSVLRFV